MAYHTGTVAAKDLFATVLGKITQIQPGESDAWWKKESSLDSDGVYTSKGETGSDRIVLVFRPGTSGHFFEAGMAKDYTPGAINTAGAFNTLNLQNLEYFTTVQDVNTQVTYEVNVTRNRVIIHVQGDKLIAQWANNVMFLGMPVRYDPTDKFCILRAASEDNSITNGAVLIEDSIGLNNQTYQWKYVESPGNPSWGQNYFLEVFHFGKTGEGLRGELEGLYGSHSDGLVDGDIIELNSKQYKVIRRVSNGLNGYPRDVLLMSMS